MEGFLLGTFERLGLVLDAKLFALFLEVDNLLLLDFTDLILHKPVLEPLSLLRSLRHLIEFPLLLLLQDFFKLPLSLIFRHALLVFKHQQRIIHLLVVLMVIQKDFLSLVPDFLAFVQYFLISFLINFLHLS